MQSTSASTHAMQDEENFVATVAIAIMRMQRWRILIGINAPALHFLFAQNATQFTDLPAAHAAAATVNRGNQRWIRSEEVVIVSGET